MIIVNTLQIIWIDKPFDIVRQENVLRRITNEISERNAKLLLSWRSQIAGRSNSTVLVRVARICVQKKKIKNYFIIVLNVRRKWIIRE